MAVTWKALAYASDVTSAITSEGVVRSTADSSLTVAIGNVGSSAAVSTADSKAVSAGVLASQAVSGVASEVVVRSTADSSIVSVVSANLSTTNSQNTSQVTTISTADSKAVSAASVALSYTNSEGIVRSTADSSLTAKAINTFGGAAGDVAMNGHQLTNQVIHTVATSAAITGVSAVVGKIVFATDSLSPWICTASV